jgi:eukaryotic-like serine/threonine-protein kinase
LDGCLSGNAVLTFISGGLSDVELAEAEAHIDRCRACRELVAHAASQSPLSSTRRDGEAPTERPARIGRYEVLHAVGVGGMGAVYAARDPDLGRVVALKLLRSSIPEANVREHRARMAREAQAMARLAHPNVITVHDIGVHGEQLFIVMELVDGGTLAERCRGNEPRDWRKVTALLLAAGRGLAAAHAAGIVHRDFKPENVLIGRNGVVIASTGPRSRAGSAPARPACSTRSGACSRRRSA